MASEETDPLSSWIQSVENGDQQAIAQLWEHCFPRLLNYGRHKLPDHLRRVLDEEDVALSAFKSFVCRAQQGSLGDIKGRDGLWKLLFCIASRKAAGYVRDQTRQKRGGGNVQGESVFSRSPDSPQTGLNQFADPRATEGALDRLSSDCQHLLDSLDDDLLQAVALLRIEGYSVAEIAQRMSCSARSVERRLNLIRRIWIDEGTDP